jgi:hypothetical protein
LDLEKKLGAPTEMEICGLKCGTKEKERFGARKEGKSLNTISFKYIKISCTDS